MAITHAYVSTKADPVDTTLVGKTKWDERHTDLVDIISKSAAYTMGTVATDEMCLTTAACTITLPTAVGITGKVYVVKRTQASGNTTVACTGAETIDGDATVLLAAQYATLAVVSNGATWSIL